MDDVMIDLETLGTVADSVIISIGACRFDLESNAVDSNSFYASVSIDSNRVLGRTITEATLIWWMKQSPEAQEVFREPKQTLEMALSELADWIGPRTHTVWSNGADFDLPMLAHAYRQIGLEVPWDHHASRCVRTYRSLPGAGAVPPPQNDHNALRDAVNQARYVQAIHQRIFTKLGREHGQQA